MEPKKDRLEEYFRKSLEGLCDQPSPSGWDVPSDKVWEGIETGIRSQHPYKRQFLSKGWLIAAIALLLGVIAWQWWAYQSKLNSLTEEVQEHTALIEKLQEKANNEASGNIRQDSNAELSINATGENKRISETAVPKDIRKESKLGKYNALKFDQGLKRTEEDERNGQEVNASPLSNTSVASIKPENENINSGKTPQSEIAGTGQNQAKPITSHPNMPGIPSSLSAREYQLKLPKPQLGVPVIPSSATSFKNDRVANWALGAYFSPTYSYRSISHKIRDISTPYEKTESPKLSYTAGLTASYDLPARWRLSSGLSYQRFNQSSRHTVGLRYNSAGAQRDANGNLVNSYTTNLETSYGEAAVEVRVANNAQSPAPNISEGRIFPVRFTAGLGLQHLGVPLLLEYHFGNERLGISLKGGLVGSILLDKGMDITDVRTLHDRLVARSTFVIQNRFLQKINDFTLDLQLSAGVHLGLTKNLVLTLEPTFRNNLTPVYENERLETRLFSLAAHTGLMYRF